MKSRRFSALSHKKRKQQIVFLISTAGISILLFFAVTRGSDLLKRRTARANEVISISELWEKQLYSQIADISEQRLLIDPMDQSALLFAGYSRYFLALSRFSAEERNFDLDLSIRHLRKLLSGSHSPNTARIQYILGKAYLSKGPYWSDLAVKYLSLTMESGYMPEDLHEYLGRAYSSAGNHQDAFEWYEKAANTHPTDRLFLILGEEAFHLALYDTAAEYYQQAVSRSRDDSVKKKGLSQLGQLYYDVSNYEMAKRVLEKLAGMDPNNEESIFLLAETYHELGMQEDASRLWHKVIRINAKHVPALRRLYD